MVMLPWYVASWFFFKWTINIHSIKPVSNSHTCIYATCIFLGANFHHLTTPKNPVQLIQRNLMEKCTKVGRFWGIDFSENCHIYTIGFFSMSPKKYSIAIFKKNLLSSVTCNQIWLIPLVSDLPMWLHHRIGRKKNTEYGDSLAPILFINP